MGPVITGSFEKRAPEPILFFHFDTIPSTILTLFFAIVTDTVTSLS